MSVSEVASPELAPELGMAVLSAALRRGGDMAELFAEERQSFSLRLDDGKIEDAVSGTERGGSLRLLRDLSATFGYVDSLDEEHLLRLAGELSLSASNGPVVAQQLSSIGSSQSPRRIRLDPAAADASAKAELLRVADAHARALSSEIRQVVAVYGESRQRVWIADSRGHSAGDDRMRVMVAVTVMAQRGDLIQTGRETLAYRDGLDSLGREVVVEMARAAAQKALTMLDSRPAPTGRMPVVLANGFGGVLFHEACGHGLEADFILKRSSIWQSKKGQQVAGPHVFAYDDGLAPDMWGGAACDDEGTPSERTTVIEAGVLTGYLSDRLRGGHLGLPLTGNGRRQDYRHLPYPRMTNTYFGPGEHTRDEIIADSPLALYAKTLSGGEVNPATGDFVFGVAEGYLIEQGRVTAPVRGATLIGNGLEVLRGIDAIADDLEVKAGTCGKNGQMVPVGSGQPTLRIRELTVGGTSLS